MKGILCSVTILSLLTLSSVCFAGAPLSIGGPFQNAADGTTLENASWSVGHISGTEVSSNAMSIDATYWYGEAGHFFSNLQVGDELVVSAGKETGEGLTRKGYYGVMSAQLTGEDPQPFNNFILREVPVPTLETTSEGILLSFSIESENAPIVGTNILGVDVYGSSDGELFTKLNDELIITSEFLHTNPAGFRYYSLALQFRGVPPSPLSAVTARSIIPGDLDDNGFLGLGDAILGLQALSGKSSSVLLEATLNGSKVELADIVYILNHI